MPKQPNAVAGPSNSKGRINKTIEKTADLLEKDENRQGKGKGKERQVLGDLSRLIGETKSLPHAIQVEKFAKTRALEIFAFQNAIKHAATQGSTRIFQTLPRHLRRRAASHNPRRVPKRLRSKAAAEIDAGDKIAKIHRKRAKIRARGNLRGQSRTAQLLLRQRDKSWLPTHLYHAKRFRMVNLWGYRLPLTPTLKSFRAAYRASTRRCMVIDTGYYGTIELEGGREEILGVLGRMAGGPFAGSKYENGSRFAEVLLYHPDSFPLELIGPVEILWCPDGGKVWVRLHPSIFEETFDALKLATSTLSAGQMVHVRDLREDLGSFDFVGPLSGRLIRRVLRVCRNESSLKKRTFDGLGDPTTFPRGLVAGFKVYDPRLHFPPPPLRKDDLAATDQIVDTNRPAEASAQLATSTVWDSEVRERSLRPTFKKSALDHRRHELSLPGTKLRPLAQDDRIQVVLLAKGDSYTLIFPRGWSQPLLHSIVYTGTLLAGLEERQARLRESGAPSFPEHYGASCRAGKNWEDRVAAEDLRRWTRRPPGRRIDAPVWQPDWQAILGFTEEEIMNGQKLWLCPEILNKHVDKAELAIRAFRRQRAMPDRTISETTGVILIRLRVEGRGSPGRMAQIYQLDGEERSRWISAVDRGPDRISTDVSPAQQLGESEALASRLVGYTTTGNFSLSRGCGFALGLITLSSWNKMVKVAEESGDGRGVLAKVRNNGGKICRLAKLEYV